MPRSENQKRKLLVLLRLLMENTDEKHMLSVQDMIRMLGEEGIRAERKSLYDDLETLRECGYDVENRKSKTTGYYIASRQFELPELKLLADAVASSRFITEKKSDELIRKIEGLASVHEARQLQRQVFVQGRVKAMNEKIYYNVDTLHEAIAQNRQIRFRYFEYTVGKTKQYRHNGATYQASPYALSWDDENYYLIAFYERRGNISHFRVDKMENIEILDLPRRGLPEESGFDLPSYSRRVFNMFGGEQETLRLEFDNALVGVVLDRFGADIPLQACGNGRFQIHVEAYVSPTLLGWLFSFGSRVRVLSPESLIELFRRRLEECGSVYAQRGAAR